VDEAHPAQNHPYSLILLLRLIFPNECLTEFIESELLQQNNKKYHTARKLVLQVIFLIIVIFFDSISN
jgi:hypothetical protein